MYMLLQIKPGHSYQSKGLHLPSGTLVEWTTEHQRVLDQLVSLLVNPPMLAYPDFNYRFVLHTDASDQGLGAILYQHQNGKLRVIEYGSQTLTAAE